MTNISIAQQSCLNILVIGDAMLDRYLNGKALRISPEAPVPVVVLEGEETNPGGAANVAANIAAMGFYCSFISIIGDDEAGCDLIKLLSIYDINSDFVVDKAYSTTQKIRLISSHQQIVRMDKECGIGDQSRLILFEKYEKHLKKADVVVFSDYGKGALIELPSMIRAAIAQGKRTIIDPKIPNPELYRGSYILKPNAAEFCVLFGDVSKEENFISIGTDALNKYDIENIIITRGSLGSILISKGKEAIILPSKARDVFDVSGAGDTMLAAIVVSIASGKPLDEAVQYGNIAAGIAVSKSGTYIVSKYEIDQEILKNKKYNKHLNLNDLYFFKKQNKKDGRRVVFTNGCFDLLHPGHVRYLSYAKSLGDILVVGLNSDNSIIALKGEKRPIYAYKERSEMLAALESVDFVVEFDAPTPIDLIKEIKPDILIKGGDYAIESIVGYDFVTSYGGCVKIAPFHDGFSSSLLIREIQEKYD